MELQETATDISRLIYDSDEEEESVSVPVSCVNCRHNGTAGNSNTNFFFYNCIVLMGFLPWEIWVAFPGESQLLQSCTTQPRVHAGCFSVSIVN